LECEINLDQLFDTGKERDRFDERWDTFLKSDPHNPCIFNKSGNRLQYLSEQLIPNKQEDKPPLLLVLGNPASHSVAIRAMHKDLNAHRKKYSLRHSRFANKIRAWY